MNVNSKYDLGDLNTTLLTVEKQLEVDSKDISNISTDLLNEVESLSKSLERLVARITQLILINKDLQMYQARVEALL